MVELQVTTTTGTDTLLDETTIEEFKASLRGELLRSGDAGYDEARRVWNGMIDRRPALIARCSWVADVIDAVNFARTNNLLVAVRGGGHNVTGSAVCDGAIHLSNRLDNNLHRLAPLRRFYPIQHPIHRQDMADED